MKMQGGTPARGPTTASTPSSSWRSLFGGSSPAADPKPPLVKASFRDDVRSSTFASLRSVFGIKATQRASPAKLELVQADAPAAHPGEGSERRAPTPVAMVDLPNPGAAVRRNAAAIMSSTMVLRRYLRGAVRRRRETSMQRASAATQIQATARRHLSRTGSSTIVGPGLRAAVTGARLVHTDGGRIGMYTVRCLSPHGGSWEVTHRYSEWRALYHALMRLAPFEDALRGLIFPRRLGACLSQLQWVLVRRMHALKAFLQAVLEVTTRAGIPAELAVFLRESTPTVYG